MEHLAEFDELTHDTGNDYFELVPLGQGQSRRKDPDEWRRVMRREARADKIRITTLELERRRDGRAAVAARKVEKASFEEVTLRIRTILAIAEARERARCVVTPLDPQSVSTPVVRRPVAPLATHASTSTRQPSRRSRKARSSKRNAPASDPEADSLGERLGALMRLRLTGASGRRPSTAAEESGIPAALTRLNFAPCRTSRS
jgi:hypothetical protein